jgi:hypothetical protein
MPHTGITGILYTGLLIFAFYRNVLVWLAHWHTDTDSVAWSKGAHALVNRVFASVALLLYRATLL